jgi:uncharacterized membrane protein YphA (DoxX/SURF4 family)
VWGLTGGGLAAIWAPIPRGWAPLALLCAVVALGSGFGLVWRRTQAASALILATYLLVWMLVFKAPAALANPAVAAAWESCGETAVLAAAAWVLFGSFTADRERPPLRFLTGAGGVRLGRSLYGLAMIAFGAAHLAYVKATAMLVPAWLPAHTAWAWLTGLTYIAAGVAVLTGLLARLAASLSALQIALFTLLVWAPRIAGANAGPDDWSEAVISWTLTAAAWVVAESYRGAAWLAFPARPRSVVGARPR